MLKYFSCFALFPDKKSVVKSLLTAGEGGHRQGSLIWGAQSSFCHTGKAWQITPEF